MKNKADVIVILGPTASGKTGLGVELAKKIGGEIISADSMQIYKFMNIGTAKVTEKEMDGIAHHLIDFVFPNEAFSVADFKTAAIKKIEEILGRQKTPIIVGGTGLYINSLTLPWSFEEKAGDEEVRWRLTAEAEVMGSEHLYERLLDVDPVSAQKIHPNNVNRVIRALEIFEVTGKQKSYLDEQSQHQELPYNYMLIGLDWPREILYERINERVDQMIEKGLIAEGEMLLDRDYNWDMGAMKAIGYKELRPYFEKQASLEDVVEILKRDTRHFAKRQMTWFRKDARIHWLKMDASKSADELTTECLDLIHDAGIIINKETD
ncbi:tRNA (adenosine(37)-N6)-dimethylallyltransferase MiaA [Eubacteriaceae bacterium ES2]|nr:tRNA (adenosine(37)-N6)-dimethylallyltransferase MiaA [Eubacteriaceae bacterium ES2]